MVQSPSWQANWFAASQEIPRISRNPKVHYRTHKRPPPVCIPAQFNPVHIPTSHFLEIHPNIIHPSTPRSPLWSLSLRLPHQDPIHPLSSPIRATCLAHRKRKQLDLKTKEINWFIGKKIPSIYRKQVTRLQSGNQTDVELLNGTVGLRQQVQHSYHAKIPVHILCLLDRASSY